MADIKLEDAGKVAKALRCAMDSCIDQDSACAVCDNYEYCYSGGNEQADAADLLDALAARNTELEAKLAEVTRERDALIKDLNGRCDVCAHLSDSTECLSCSRLTGTDNWKWRGVCAENTKGAGHD